MEREVHWEPFYIAVSIERLRILSGAYTERVGGNGVKTENTQIVYIRTHTFLATLSDRGFQLTISIKDIAGVKTRWVKISGTKFEKDTQQSYDPIRKGNVKCKYNGWLYVMIVVSKFKEGWLIGKFAKKTDESE